MSFYCHPYLCIVCACIKRAASINGKKTVGAHDSACSFSSAAIEKVLDAICVLINEV